MFAEMIIIENYVNDDTIVDIAKAVLKSQDIHENSWDVLKKEYKLSCIEASEKAVSIYKLEDFWVSIIGHWNNSYWNDVQYWAEAVIKK